MSSLVRRALVCATFLLALARCASGLPTVSPDGPPVQAVEGSGPAVSAPAVSAPAVSAPADSAPAVVAAESIDETTLEAALAGAGIDLPEGSSVYAVRLAPDGTATAYEAGEGATYDGFWPASSVKLLAAVGALEYLSELGFTGEARITMGGETFTVANLYEEAIAVSSNEAYDILVRIAGVDWLNEEFLSPANGFPETVIQRSYTGWGVDVSPAMTIVEADRRVTVPAREATGTYGCDGDGNCSSLLELTESVRRVTLDAQLQEDERFDIAAGDIAGLTAALLTAEGFVEPAVTEVLGQETLVYNKPGYVAGAACLDVALLTNEPASLRYLLAVETPEDGPLCPGLVEIAAATLRFLTQVDD